MRQSDYTKHRALSRHESYVKQKAKWRDKAIEWQADMYNQNYSRGNHIKKEAQSSYSCHFGKRCVEWIKFRFVSNM